jgi:FMN phosphatase YigB (HAD superfamily)
MVLARTTTMPRDLRAVFFDIGGTLIGPNLRLLGAWLRAAGIACTDERVAEVEPRARRAHAERRDAVKGTPRFPGLYVEEVLRCLPDAALDAGRLDDTIAQVLAIALAAGYPVVPVWNDVLPGVAEGLARLRARGLRLAAVSNSDGTAEAVLVSAGIRGYFEAVLDSHLVGFSKPDPRLFDAARAALGVEREQVVHVGDLYEIDIAGARAAGLAAILIDPGGFWPDAPCPRVPGPAEAIALLLDDRPLADL